MSDENLRPQTVVTRGTVNFTENSPVAVLYAQKAEPLLLEALGRDVTENRPNPAVCCMFLLMYVYFVSVMHYTCYVNNVGKIKLIQIHPKPRPTPETLEDRGWVLKGFLTRVVDR